MVTAGDDRVALLGISKAFGRVHAVRDVSITARCGDVTAVVGQNGAGKSTLMKILAGSVRPDRGTILVDGSERRFASPLDAVRAGIGMVYQETALVADLAVWENVVLGWEPAGRLGALSAERSRTAVGELMDRYELAVPLDSKVSDLPVNQQQQVEILKVLHRGGEVIILDEPTSVLTPQQREGLFAAIATLCRAGRAVLFISHKLDEVIAIAQQIYVMRDGELVASTPNRGVDSRSLATLIVGREIKPVVRRPAAVAPSPCVVASSISCRPVHGGAGVRSASFTLRRGEVVGLAGVAGSGQHELVHALCGLHELAGGTVTISGSQTVELTAGWSGPPALLSLREAGLAHVPSDRNHVGTLSGQPLWVSTLPRRRTSGPFGRWGLLDRAAARKVAAGIIADGNIVASGPDASPASLSGGNLQKFIVQRELSAAPDVLIAEEPTRGIDVGAARHIRGELRRLAAGGCAVLVSSTDLDELVEICDRVLVMFEGRIALDRPCGELTTELLGAAMTGLELAEVAS